MFRKLLILSGRPRGAWPAGVISDRHRRRLRRSCCKKTCTPVTETRKVASPLLQLGLRGFLPARCNLMGAWFKGWYPRKD